MTTTTTKKNSRVTPKKVAEPEVVEIDPMALKAAESAEFERHFGAGVEELLAEVQERTKPEILRDGEGNAEKDADGGVIWVSPPSRRDSEGNVITMASMMFYIAWLTMRRDDPDLQIEDLDMSMADIVSSTPDPKESDNSTSERSSSPS